MRRHVVILLAIGALAALYDNRGAQRTPGGAATDDTRRVVLVVSDGLRWQEVFRGADSAILFGDAASAGGDMGATRRRYWRPTLAARRAALMPFVSGTMAREGRAFGNRDAGSRVDATNGLKFSYPGYNEMLTGRPDPRIDSNEHGPNPNVTVFEWLNRRDDFHGRVAAFGTWDTFRDIFNVARSGIDVQTNGAEPHDALVQRAVLPYLRKKEPLALFVGFAETDDWGHEGKYDRFLDATHAVDGFLAQLWSAIQSDARYRDRTTLIFTADHGRGRTPGDWRNHGKDVPGAEENFIVMLGPAAGALGSRGNAAHVLGEVARATAAAVGLEYRTVRVEAVAPR
jgi:Type I phosphodiesterase / nucleotide pyrophosphatase